MWDKPTQYTIIVIHSTHRYYNSAVTITYLRGIQKNGLKETRSKSTNTKQKNSQCSSVKNNAKFYSLVMHMYDGCFYKFENKTNVKYIRTYVHMYRDMGSSFEPIQPRDIDRR